MPATRTTARRLTAALLAGTLLAAATPAPRPAAAPRWDTPGDANPILPGYFADPSIVHFDGHWYVFATMDPWGGDRLSLWTSANGRDWRFSTPDWPTKAAATSPTSGDAKVWAPSVVQTRDGRWFMYVSVGSEIWVGTAPSPAGPWRDANGGKPLVAKSFAPQFHMIDAEAFIDDDGQAYLYWGSGLNWVNGHCFAVKLKPDMVSFDGSPRDVTPANYFEAPFMLKAGGHYLLSYSDGNTTTDTYKVRYAVGDTPMGPFREAVNSPILQTDLGRDVVSPGHHAVFRSGGRSYILYGRQALPWPRKGEEVLRQVGIDPLDVRADGTIGTVTPSHGSVIAGFAAHRTTGYRWTAANPEAARAADDNYATLWKPAGSGPATLVADLGRLRALHASSVRPEYADRPYRFGLETSADGRRWTTVRKPDARTGSPIQDRLATSARYVRLTFPDGDAALWEWVIS